MANRITLSFTWRVVLIIVIVVLCLTAGLGYTSYRLYKKIIATEETQKLILEKQETERLAQEERARILLDSQQQALDQAKEELLKTKADASKTSAQIKSLTQTIENQAKETKDIVITSTDLTPYTSGVVQVICATKEGISSGSGSLWTFKEIPQAVVTNYHVIKDATSCVMSVTNSANVMTGLFGLEGSVYSFNKNTDAAILAIGASISPISVPIENYNYGLAKVRKCTTLMPVGSPVVIMGFPAYAKRDSTLTITNMGTVNVIYRTATNGIISGYDTSQSGEPNYFVSAKIDNGNSGGMALAKDANGICTLGLPTWLSVGNYETQGLVQNILNVLPKDQQ